MTAQAQRHVVLLAERACPVRSALKRTPLQDLNSFSIMFSTYQKIEDLFCPVFVPVLDFHIVCEMKLDDIDTMVHAYTYIGKPYYLSTSVVTWYIMRGLNQPSPWEIGHKLPLGLFHLHRIFTKSTEKTFRIYCED